MTHSSQHDADDYEAIEASFAAKLNHVRLMADGSIMTCLGPADRHALRMLVDELENERGCVDKLSDAYGVATGLLAEWLDCGHSADLAERTTRHLMPEGTQASE